MRDLIIICGVWLLSRDNRSLWWVWDTKNCEIGLATWRNEEETNGKVVIEDLMRNQMLESYNQRE